MRLQEELRVAHQPLDRQVDKSPCTRRLAQAMLALVDSGTPPLRLALGTDTLQAIADKHAFVQAEVKAWRALSASTDFPKEALAA